METPKIGEKIRELRKKVGMSQKEFAQAIGVSYGALQGYEYGEVEPRRVILQSIAAHFGVPLSYFIPVSKKPSLPGSNLANILSVINETENKKIYLNLYDNVRVSAGYGSFADDSVAKKIPVSSQFLRDVLRVPVKEYDVIRVIGDSMEPFIKDSDLVLVDRSERVRNGDIVIAILEDSLYVKKYLFNPIRKIIKLTSLNDFYQDIVIEPQEQIQLNIIGKVRAKFSVNSSSFK